MTEEINQKMTEEINQNEEAVEKPLNFLIIPVESLNFSQRVLNVFQKNNIETVSDIVLFGARRLRKMEGLGSQSVNEIKYKLAQFNIKL